MLDSPPERLNTRSVGSIDAAIAYFYKAIDALTYGKVPHALGDAEFYVGLAKDELRRV